MAQRKARAVFTADPQQLSRVQAVVRSGEFESASAFLRAAIEDKLRAIENALMAAQLEVACDGQKGADDGLIDAQAWDD